MKGGRTQGRQKKTWEYNNREWTSLELAKSQRAVENSEKWRKLVVKSSVVHQQTGEGKGKADLKEKTKTRTTDPEGRPLDRQVSRQWAVHTKL